MILIDPGALVQSGLNTQYWGVAYFSGDIPDTQEDIPFSMDNIDGVFMHDQFCGYITVTPLGYDVSKYTTNDAIKFSLNSAWKDVIPFNRVEDYGNGEFKYYAKDVRFMVNGKEWNKDTYVPYDSDNGLFGMPHSGLNQFMHSALNNTGYYTRWTPWAEEHGVGDYMEITFDQAFTLKRLELDGWASTYSERYRVFADVMGWNYDTQQWELLVGTGGAYAETNLEVNASFETDKYRFVLTNTATGHPIYSKLFFVSETAPVSAVAQPTWMLLIPRHNTVTPKADRQMPFVWASCSGPTGSGELKLSKDQFAPGDYLALLTNKIEYEPFWEEV